jgi:CO dehydrogenase/acetyl-CoA synthase beta subunit
MKLFDEVISETGKIITDSMASNEARELIYKGGVKWPIGERSAVILSSDCGLELGNPKDVSATALLYTENMSLVSNNRITLIGPEISESNEDRLPFGKIVIIGASGFDAENTHDRHMEMDLIKYKIGIKGFMVKAMSQSSQEWCRISKESIKKGFDLSTLGSLLINEYRKLDYVKTIEIFFITSKCPQMDIILRICDSAITIANAMKKINEDPLHECGACGYENLCGTTEDLVEMKKNMKKTKN